MKKFLAMIVFVIVLGIILVACKTQPATKWKPVEGRIMTRWAAAVKPDLILPEYPRPQMVREEWLNLNGLWDYAIVAKDAGQPAAWDGKILVPFALESALSGVGKPVGAAKELWYRRTVAVPKKWRGGKILLHFGAVDWESTVWINGREAGTHRGGYDPFTYDITDALAAGTKQEIVLRVLDPTDEANSPIARGKQVMKPHGIFYTAVTGIWQTVWIEPVPESYFAKLKITPDIDRGRFTFEPTVLGNPEGTSLTVTVSRGQAVMATSDAPAGAPAAVDIPQPELWSPDNPVLYDIKAVLKKDGKVLDEVTSYAGMRKIALAKDDQGYLRLFLNDKPLFQFGPLDQGWWPDGLYTAPTDDALRYDLETIKALGMNMLRKHVKVEPDRLYYWCDKLGVLVWQDMPSALYEREAHPAEVLAQRDAQWEGEWKAIIDALSNHPSIVMWVPFNEGWGQYDTERITAWTKRHDPTRLVNNASGWTDKGAGDVSDIHSYPGPAMPAVEERRAAVLGEFGGLGLPLRGHLWQEEGNWGYRNFDDIKSYEARYTDLIKNLYPLVDRGLAAAVYTQTSDCEVEVNGLMTYDREITKLEPARFAALNRGYLPPYFVADQTQFVGPSFAVELAARAGASIRDTLDGSEPGPNSPVYERPLMISGETTVKARAFWPSGVSSLVESRTFRPTVPVPPSAKALTKKGLAYEYFEGRFDKLPNFAALKAGRSGTAPRPDLAAAEDKDEFALRFKGSIHAPETGVYVFYVSSDDGSKLSVAGKEIIVNDGVHGLAEEKAEVALEGGWHPFELVYFQGAGGLGLEVSWRGPGFEKTPIPAGAFGR
ncbi:MAG: chitobiase/beta-hexosaminidase C-terminal domain-containing protein [Acidobacteria bacterium]|nr:chitobiase/beta-hexosaminidase C-terminal domain-containing protein [Acidobacteriota bacterium]